MNSVTKRTYYTMNDCDIVLQGLVDNDEISIKLADLLTNKYQFNWITFTDVEIRFEDIPSAIDEDKVTQWSNRFKSIYDETKDRYVKLIGLYKDQENNLLNKVGSSTTTKFNDTPQNVNVGDTDEYTSTYTHVSTEVDPGEVMSRLDNIYSKYKDLYGEWMKEFDILFGTSTL